MAKPPLKITIEGGKETVQWLSDWAPRPQTRIKILLSVRQTMKLIILKMFATTRQGRTSRGVRWEPFADQYARKTDGATVPAWGGVKRIAPAWTPPGVPRGKVEGSVLGKKRPSGRRISQSSNLMQDTGTMRAQVGNISSVDDKRIRFGPTVNYARRQNQLRPFMFYELPKDANSVNDAAFKTYQRLMMAQ